MKINKFNESSNNYYPKVGDYIQVKHVSSFDFSNVIYQIVGIDELKFNLLNIINKNIIKIDISFFKYKNITKEEVDEYILNRTAKKFNI